MRRLAVLSLGLILILAACDANGDSGDDDSARAVDDPTPTVVPSTPTPTGTPEPDPTATPEPSPSQQPSATPEPTATSVPEPTATEAPDPTVITARLPEECIDINTASAEELREIIHIDEDRSQQIISLRPFSSIDDLVRVNGIANERLQDIRRQGAACASAQ